MTTGNFNLAGDYGRSFNERAAIVIAAENADLLAKCQQLQTALDEYKHRYHDLAESLPQTIFEIDIHGNLKYSNAYGYQSMGYSQAEVESGFRVVDTFLPEDRQRIQENIGRIVKGEKIMGQEYTARRKDGSTFPVMIFSSPIKVGDSTIGLRGIIIDISERKRYEEALKNSEEKYRTLFDQKLDGVVVMDQSLKILLANSAAAEIFGFESPGDLSGLNFFDFISRDDEFGFHYSVRNVFENGLTQLNEVRCKRVNGAEIWIALVCHSINYQGKMAGLASFRDITMQKRADEELRRSQVEIQNLYAHSHMVREEERNLIAREIHDELGQSLTALRFDLYWLQKRLDQGDHEVQEKAKAMSAVISDSIASVQRICSQLSPPILEELGIVAALEWHVGEFEKHFGISAEFRSGVADLETTRECSIAIFRIVQEALTNVARHAGASRVTVRLSRENGNLRVSVSDNGKGISQSEISSSYSYGLLGMKERALAFGGQFEIKRGRKGGTVVAFSLPVIRSGASQSEENTRR
jgi:PAS domain S-box-containing protein